MFSSLRTDSKPYSSKVWQSGAMGQTDSSKLQVFPGKVLSFVDEFISDWQAANKRKDPLTDVK